MKIEIEWNCSHEATLRISGRELKVVLSPGCTALEGLPKGSENYFGSILAGKLYGIIGSAMQAQCIAEDALSPDGSQDVTWKRMNNATAEAVERRMW